MAATDIAMKPTILLAQGAFQLPVVYETFTKQLEERGFPVAHPALPTLSNSENSSFDTTTLIDDALAVRIELIRLIEYEWRTVVVVMHSYGGLVGSEAASEDLSYSYRQARGLRGGVVLLFFYSAFVLPEGQSLLSAFGESPLDDVRPDGRIFLKDAERVLYNDLSPDEAALWASRLISQSRGALDTRLTRAAYRYVPSTYLICENDRDIDSERQEEFAARANSRVERCNASHSPMLSQPDMLVQKVVTATEQAFASSIENDKTRPRSSGSR